MSPVSLRYLLFFLASSSLAHAFSFTFGKASQCDPIQLQWTGGQPPFQLLLTPLFGTPRGIPIPATAQGTFAIPQFPFPAGQRLLMTMSDATGFGTGGTSPLITVAPSTSGQACNTADPGVDFSYELNTALQQCRPYTFSGYKDAVLPVTVVGLIPAGQSFVLHPPPRSRTFDWTTNVAAGTSVIFIMTDARGQQGGASDLKVVGASPDTSCLDASSPSTTGIPPPGSTSPTTTQPHATTSRKPSSPTKSPAQTSAAAGMGTGAIAGAVAGGLVAVAALITLGVFFLRKRNRAAHVGGIRPFGSGAYRHSQRLSSMDNINNTGPDPSHVHPYPLPTVTASAAPGANQYLPSNQYMPPNQYALQNQYMPTNQYTPQVQHTQSPHLQTFQSQQVPNPFNALPPPDAYSNASPSSTQYLPPDHYAANPFNAPVHQPYSPQPMNQYHTSHPSTEESEGIALSSAGRQKAEMAAAESTQRPTRFVLHADVEEVAPPNSDGVVELPPQYSDRRAPIASLPLQDTRAAPPPQHVQPFPHARSPSRSPSPTGLAYLSD